MATAPNASFFSPVSTSPFTHVVFPPVVPPVSVNKPSVRPRCAVWHPLLPFAGLRKFKRIRYSTKTSTTELREQMSTSKLHDQPSSPERMAMISAAGLLAEVSSAELLDKLPATELLRKFSTDELLKKFSSAELLEKLSSAELLERFSSAELLEKLPSLELMHTLERQTNTSENPSTTKPLQLANNGRIGCVGGATTPDPVPATLGAPALAVAACVGAGFAAALALAFHRATVR